MFSTKNIKPQKLFFLTLIKIRLIINNWWMIVDDKTDKSYRPILQDGH